MPGRVSWTSATPDGAQQSSVQLRGAQKNSTELNNVRRSSVNLVNRDVRDPIASIKLGEVKLNTVDLKGHCRVTFRIEKLIGAR